MKFKTLLSVIPRANNNFLNVIGKMFMLYSSVSDKNMQVVAQKIEFLSSTLVRNRKKKKKITKRCECNINHYSNK